MAKLVTKVVINVHTFSCTVHIFFPNHNWNSNRLQHIPTPTQKFIKIHPLEAQSFHVDRQTDTELTQLTVTLFTSVHTPKNQMWGHYNVKCSSPNLPQFFTVVLKHNARSANLCEEAKVYTKINAHIQCDMLLWPHEANFKNRPGHLL